jgi:hypothetical protein
MAQTPVVAGAGALGLRLTWRASNAAAGDIHGMHLDHALGQIEPYASGFTSNDGSCNLLHGTSPFNGLRLTTSNPTNPGASTPLTEGGTSLRIARHLTFASRLRRQPNAGDLKRETESEAQWRPKLTCSNICGAR